MSKFALPFSKAPRFCCLPKWLPFIFAAESVLVSRVSLAKGCAQRVLFLQYMMAQRTMLWTMSMWTALLVDFMSPTPLQSKSLNVSMTFLGLSWITSICNSINVQPLHVFIFKPNWSPKQRQPIKRPYAIHAAFMVFFKQLVNVFVAYCKSNCQQGSRVPALRTPTLPFVKSFFTR